jgi:2-polyprenyl-3-methyl-5-hydroxy-6-metoxy-1,4-benzoquinol methylase
MLNLIQESSDMTQVTALQCSAFPGVGEFLPSALPLVRQLVGDPVRVIDVGCGQGQFVKAIRELAVEAIGFDPVLRHETNFYLRDIGMPRVSSG